MNHEELYQAVFKRKSVRKFDPQQVDKNVMANMNAFLSALQPMVPGIRTEFKLMTSEKVRGMFKVEAPHFLALFSEEKDRYESNAGFLLQQVDLFLSANNLGSCWQGGPKLVRTAVGRSDLKFIILLAFGRPAEAVHRKSISEFKRKPLTSISTVVGNEELLEAARLAPSAGNSQSWYFTGDDGVIHAYGNASSLFGSKNRINVGIALCHLWLAAMHSNKRPEIVVDASAVRPVKSYSYVASLRMS